MLLPQTQCQSTRAHRQRDVSSPDPCTWLLLISNHSLSVLEFRASQRDVPRAAAQGPVLATGSVGRHPCQAAALALRLTSHGKRNWKTPFSPRPYNCSIRTAYLHASHLQHTYFPVASQSVMSILISMSCWNFAPSKNGPSHHIINSPSPNPPSISAAYQSLPRPFRSPWTPKDPFAG